MGILGETRVAAGAEVCLKNFERVVEMVVVVVVAVVVIFYVLLHYLCVYVEEFWNIG